MAIATTHPSLTGSGQKERTRPAIWTLAFLSPLTAEVLTGSTPILLFLIPFTMIYQVAFYGSGALLIREIVRRRGLGWPSIVLLGAAYGILEEGLVNVTWFNPYWPDVLSYQGYGRALELNWVWALNLTAFHAIVSITIPILLAELIFPAHAARPWLSRKGLWAVGITLTLASALGLWVFGFLLYRGPDFAAPPLVPYLGTLALAVGLVAGGLLLPRSALRPAMASSRRLPPLWFLRIFGFVAIFLYFADESVLHTTVPFPMACGSIALTLALIAWRVWAWSRHPGWNARHMLALASGVLGIFVFVTAPFEEIMGHVGTKPTHGTVLVALGYLILLITVSRRTAQRVRLATTGIPPISSPSIEATPTDMVPENH